jgi:hypothetical protein
MFAMGIGDAEEFQERLQDEFSALEVSCRWAEGAAWPGLGLSNLSVHAGCVCVMA